MAGHVLKKRRLVNPARRRRNMSAKQIKYFGTARQKAGLKHRRRNASYRKVKKQVRKHQRAGSLAPGPMFQKWRKAARTSKTGRRRRNQSVTQAEHAAQDAIRSVERAAEDAIGEVTHAVNRGRRNVGEILTVIPANPGRKRRRAKMAATRRKNRRRNRGAVANRRRTRRRNTHRARNRSYGHRRRTRNRNPKVIVRYRNRRHSRRNSHRRRNPNGNFLTGDAGAVVGILGGAAVTKMITGFLPSNLSTGWPGYITQSIVAVVAGQVTGKVAKNSRLGNFVTIGGLVMVGLQVLADLFPQLQLPFTVSSGTPGMGMITSSNFFVPQVNLPGSMASFVPPAAIPAPVVVPASSMNGLSAVGTSAMNSGIRRVGRLR